MPETTAGVEPEVQYLHFNVSGAFLTQHARDLVREGTWDRGIAFLVDNLEGMTYDTAIRILKGEQRLIGDTADPEGINLDVEDPTDPNLIDYLGGCDFVYRGRIKVGSRWYRPYAMISGYGPEDAQAAMRGLYPAVTYLYPAGSEFGNPAEPRGRLTTFRDVSPPISRQPREGWILQRVSYYLDNPRDDRVAYMDVPASIRREGDDTGLWGCIAVAFQVCDAPPIWGWGNAPRSPAAAVQALYDIGFFLERRGALVGRKASPTLREARVRAVEAQADEAALGKDLLRSAQRGTPIADMTYQLADAHAETQKAKRALQAQVAFDRWCADHPDLADQAKADPTAVLQDLPQTYREALGMQARLRELGRCGEIYADLRVPGSCVACDRAEGHLREGGHSALTRNAPFEATAWEERSARDWEALTSTERRDARAVIDSGALAGRLERYRAEIQQKAGPQDGPGWIDLPVYPDPRSDTPDRVLRVPRDPFLCWSLWRTTGRHLMPDWEPVCPQGLKMVIDDVYHTDWIVGAGLGLDCCYGAEGKALSESASRLMGDIQETLLQFEATVLSGGDRVVIGTAVHPKMGDTVSPNHIAILPDARPGWESVVRSAGATIVPVGGELCHLATVATEAMRVILRVPGCMTKYPPRTPLTVDAGAGKILIHNRSVRSLLGEDPSLEDP